MKNQRMALDAIGVMLKTFLIGRAQDRDPELTAELRKPRMAVVAEVTMLYVSSLIVLY